VSSSLGLPQLSAPAIRAVAYANGATGLAALARGDTATALLRARENAAVARQLLRQLGEADAATAAVLLMQASDVLRAAAETRAQPTLAAEAERLSRAAEEVREPIRLRYRDRLLALFADPADRAGIPFVADSMLAPVTRASVEAAVIGGHCLNAREMLFGLDERRIALLDDVGIALRDLSRAAELVETDRRWLRRWVENQKATAADNVSSIDPGARPSVVLRSLGWLGLGAVRDRMLFCRALLF
jgi:hypothetical protein